VVLVALAGVFWLCYLRLLLPLRDRLDLAIEVISSVADVFCFVGALVLTIVKTDNVRYTCAEQGPSPASDTHAALLRHCRFLTASASRDDDTSASPAKVCRRPFHLVRCIEPKRCPIFARA